VELLVSRHETIGATSALDREFHAAAGDGAVVASSVGGSQAKWNYTCDMRPELGAASFRAGRRR
jgi:hypothetical protein